MSTLPHGSISTYCNHACSCGPCREAWAEYNFDRRRRSKLAPGDGRHGTINGYTNYMCRCAECRAAKAAYAKAARERAS